jgi:hypothetical protein
MSQIQIPESLLQQIEATGIRGSAVDVFVEQAVREKLAIASLSSAERRKRFFELSDEMRTAMHEQGLTEEQLLAEFDARRHST